MHSLEILQAIFLGAVEGLTEFLPISSTGHLILLIDLLGFKGPPGKVFEIVIQLGAILAVCVVYYKRLLNVVMTLPKRKDSRRFATGILYAFLPTVILGALLHDFIKSVLFSPLIVSIALIVGGIIILIIERLKIKPKYTAIERMPRLVPLYIGLAQALAMIPGVSRAGATIMGALLLKVDRKTATEFSFFLAIPTMLAATVFDLYKNYKFLTYDGGLIIAVGFVTAFLTAWIVVKSLITFIGKHGFAPFAYYRIALGVLMLALLYI